MEAATGCDCLFCVGENGKRLSLISHEIADAAGLIAAARKDRVTIRATDQIFVFPGIRAVACVRMIRRKLARLCGCWVAPEERGKGIGKMLVCHRIAYLEQHTSVGMIDTFAFRKGLFLNLGFVEKRSFQIGTTCCQKVVAR